MILSAESRGISLGSDLPDLCVTTTHLPEAVNAFEFLNQHVSSTGFVIPLDQVFETLKRLPIDALGGSAVKLSVDDPVRHMNFVLAALLSDVTAERMEVYRKGLGELDPVLLDGRQDKPANTCQAAGTDVALSIAAALTAEEFGFLFAAWSELKDYEASFAYSPELGSIPLSRLIEGGAKSACLVPLMTGLHGSITAQMAGSYALAFESTVVGAGVTLVALSALWLSDKILTGLKSATLQGSQGKGGVVRRVSAKIDLRRTAEEPDEERRIAEQGLRRRAEQAERVKQREAEDKEGTEKASRHGDERHRD